MQRESVMLEMDTVDTGSSLAPWLDLAQQLKQDLTSIILMSEADLQVLPCSYFSDRTAQNCLVYEKIKLKNNSLAVSIKIFGILSVTIRFESSLTCKTK